MTIDNEVDFMSAIYDFIVNFTGISESVVFRGYQSRMVLPNDDEFCIYTPMMRSRIGTNKRTFSAVGKTIDENGDETEIETVSVDVQIDFYGENAQRYAQAIETAARSRFANEYFKKNSQDIRCLYAESIRNLTGVDDTNQYALRWSLNVSFSFDTSITITMPWFESVNLVNIKNVDVYFPPSD